MRTGSKIISAVVAVAAAVTGGFALMPHASAGATACSGEQVVICVTTASTDTSAMGKAKVEDAEGGGNYVVSVSRMYLQRYYEGRWVTLTFSDDYDGYWDVSDSIKTYWANCNSASHRAKVLVKWKLKGGSTQNTAWKYGPRVRC